MILRIQEEKETGTMDLQEAGMHEFLFFLPFIQEQE